jgi:hypothetical protein
MSRINKLDAAHQDKVDQRDLEYDRFYGWEYDVSDMWYEHLYTKKLGELDCFYHFSYWRSC